MRTVLALGLLFALCTFTDAVAREHYSKSRNVMVRPSRAASQSFGMIPSSTVPGGARIAVPGWTEQQTQDWMDSYHGTTD